MVRQGNTRGKKQRLQCRQSRRVRNMYISRKSVADETQNVIASISSNEHTGDGKLAAKQREQKDPSTFFVTGNL
jgi:hypothetical protein